MSSTVTITCKEHDKVLADGIRQLFRDEYFFDANVAYNDVSFKVHRLILAVFLPTLKEHMNDVKSSDVNSFANDLYIVNVDNVASAAEDVQALVEFVYSGKVTIPKERIKHFGQLASDLNVESVVKAVEEYWQTEEVKVDVEPRGDRIPNVDELDAMFVEETSSDDVSKGGISIVPSLVGQEAATPDEGQIRIDESYCANQAASTDTYATENRKQDANEGPTIVRVTKTALKTNSRNLQSILPAKSTKRPLIFVKKLKSGKSSQVIANPARGKNPAFCTRTAKSHPESGGTATELDKMPSDGSDWTPPVTSRKKIKAIVRKAAASFKSTKTFDRGATDYDPKEKESIDRFCQQVLETWEDVRAMKPIFEEAGESGGKTTNECVDVTMVATEFPTCKKCDKKFLTTRSLNKHAKMCGTEQVPSSYVCDTCGYCTKKRVNYNTHIKDVHGKDPTNPQKAPLSLKCPQCPFTCNAKYKLRGHILRRHTAEREHKCPECEYSAMYRGEIERHVRRTHRNEKLYVCDICGNRYQRCHGLKRHIQVTHKGIKPHKCEYCGKQYSGLHDLNIHIQTKHTYNLERHVCHICANSYVKRTGLQYHMRHVHGMSLEPLRKPYAPRQPATAKQEDYIIEDSTLLLTDTN